MVNLMVDRNVEVEELNMPFSRNVLSDMRTERKLGLLMVVSTILLLGVISSSPFAFANPTPCDGTIDSGTFDEIVVESGDVCEIRDVTVNGNVKVNNGGTLLMFDSTVLGSVEGEGARIISVQHTAIDGNVKIIETKIFTVIGSNTVQGNIEILDSSSAFSLVVDNLVSSNIVFNNNLFAQSNVDGNIISGNTVGGSLECKDNTQAPTDRYSGPNTASDKKDQCKNL